MMIRYAMTVLLAAWLPAASARADEAAALLAGYKEASGGARWDAAKTLETSGKLHAGGLEGTFRALHDLGKGRSASQYKLGPIEGGEGYDGSVGWSRDPGGEIAVLDAPEAKRQARSQAWLDTYAFWYPQRMAATWGKPESREDGGRRYAVVTATPEGGDAVTLWFDVQTHLLARIAQRQAQDTVTTVYDDWREADGLRQPFHAVTDYTDAAGRTDPRRRTEVRIEQIKLDPAVADADFAVPAMTATVHIDDPGGVTRIPFVLVNNHIYAEGSIDGKPARFLVDTGGANLLSPQSAQKFGLHGEGKLAVRGAGDGEGADVSFAHAKEVRLGAAKLANPVFMIIGLGPFADVEGIDSDGLVGYEMFRRFGVTIDYAKRELVLAEQAKFVPPAGATAVPFALAERIPIVQGRLDGVPARISIDTGSRASLTLHSPFVKKNGLVAKYHAAPEAVVGWGVGGASRGLPVRMGTLELGAVTIGGIAGDLYTGDKSVFASPELDGNLGSGVMKRFTIAFDYAAKRMYFAPNADSSKPDAFDRSGLWLLKAGDALKIVDVAAGSAAVQAGLKNDDLITAIGGEVATKRTLSEWREHLRTTPAGTRIAIDYRRGGRPAHAELVLADRIPPR